MKSKPQFAIKREGQIIGPFPSSLAAQAWANLKLTGKYELIQLTAPHKVPNEREMRVVKTRILTRERVRKFRERLLNPGG